MLKLQKEYRRKYVNTGITVNPELGHTSTQNTI